jgi:hypothetical protein
MGLSWIIYVQQLRILSFSGYLRLAMGISMEISMGIAT